MCTIEAVSRRLCRDSLAGGPGSREGMKGKAHTIKIVKGALERIHRDEPQKLRNAAYIIISTDLDCLEAPLHCFEAAIPQIAHCPYCHDRPLDLAQLGSHQFRCQP